MGIDTHGEEVGLSSLGDHEWELHTRQVTHVRINHIVMAVIFVSLSSFFALLDVLLLKDLSRLEVVNELIVSVENYCQLFSGLWLRLEVADESSSFFHIL